MASKPSMSDHTLNNKYESLNNRYGGGKSDYDNEPNNLVINKPDLEQKTGVNRELD